jgi:hypothetical protein
MSSISFSSFDDMLKNLSDAFVESVAMMYGGGFTEDTLRTNNRRMYLSLLVLIVVMVGEVIFR